MVSTTRQDPEYQLIHMNSAPSFRRKNRQRGLLDSNSFDGTSLQTSPFRLKSIMKWKWWQFLAIFLAIIIFAEWVMFIINCYLLSNSSEPIHFGKGHKNLSLS